MARPVDIARRLCPKARQSYLSAFETGDALFQAAGITTPLRLAHFLAQAFHETGGLTIEWESGNYSADRLFQVFGVGHHSAAVTRIEAQELAYKPQQIFERVYGLGNPKKAQELGNTKPGDGYRYRGGGVLQTTGRGNYRRMGQKCGVDFETAPDLIVSPLHALKPALAEWTEGHLNTAADSDDIVAITRRINGGVNGLDQRRDWYRKIRPLIDTVDLKPIAAPVTPTAPPDVPPIPKPAPAPQPDVTGRKHIASVSTFLASVAAALKAHTLELAISIVIVGLLLAVAVHLLWPKKGS